MLTQPPIPLMESPAIAQAAAAGPLGCVAGSRRVEVDMRLAAASAPILCHGAGDKDAGDVAASRRKLNTPTP